jgi:hypothetical protein
MYIINSNVPKIDPGELHILLFTSVMKIFAADSEILCQRFASYLQDGTQTIGYLLHVFQNKTTGLK